jgi:hypothetical protein
VGKSWLACALGHKACRDNRSVLYQRVPKLFAELGLARGDGRYAIPDNSAASIEAFVRANVKTGTTLLTDGHRSYPGLTDYRRRSARWPAISCCPGFIESSPLMKRWGLGTYHGLRRKHIDTYLNEFVFR